MADFNTSKVDGDTVAASEWNQLASIDNFITTSGQTPATGNLNQTGIGAARYSSGGQFFTDSGTANAYVLSPVSPFKAPVSSSEGYFVGMTIRFRAGNANSGASTVNVNSAGTKNLKKEDGTTDLAAGDIPTDRDVEFRYNGTSFVLVITAANAVSKGLAYLPSRIIISNNVSDATNDIDAAAGNFQFSDGTGQAILSTITKRLDASWAAGTNQGGLDTGSKANSTQYAVFAIYNPTSGISDTIFTLASNSSPLLPSGYTKFTKIGYCFTDGSGVIRPFYQDGTRFTFRTPYNVVSSGTATSRTNFAGGAPNCLTTFFGIMTSGSATITYSIITNLDSTDLTPSATQANIAASSNFAWSGYFSEKTNSNSEVGFRSNNTNATVNLYVKSFEDSRL